MKILKFKSTLFSLMAIAMVTVFLTSCEEDKLPLPTDDMQKSEIPAAAQYLIEEDREVTFNLPARLDDADKETIELYIASMTADQMQEMEESYKIEKYLESIDRAEEVINDLGQLDVLTLSDLGKYTSEQELADFNSFDVNSVIESRCDPPTICGPQTKCDPPNVYCQYLGPYKGYILYRAAIYQRCCRTQLFGGTSCNTQFRYGPITAGGC